MFSPTSDRTRKPTALGAASQNPQPHIPMVQVMGSQGPVYVYRPWTTEDLMTVSKQLPKPEKGGTGLAKPINEFVREFSPTSAEMAHIMMNRMSPAKFGLLRKCFTEHHQPSKPTRHTQEEDEDEADTNYCSWLHKLLQKKTDSFHTTCDLSKVSKIPQQPNEPVEGYLERLNIVFDNYSGTTRPADYLGTAMVPYEALLKNSFMEGMLSNLAEDTKISRITWDDTNVRLAKVLRHAHNAQVSRAETVIQE